MNKRGFSPILVIVIFAVILFGVFLIFRNQVSKLPVEVANESSESSTYTPSDDQTSNELTDVTCENMHAVFKVPANFEKYEEINSQGEHVCLLSNKIQDGHISPTRVYITAFATQKTSSSLNMTSRQAAERDTKQYGGMTDLPEAVVKKGKFATYHVIAPDALKNTAVWSIDSISNDDTDTFYTITVSVPKELQGTVDSQALMNGYSLSEDF